MVQRQDHTYHDTIPLLLSVVRKCIKNCSGSHHDSSLENAGHFMPQEKCRAFLHQEKCQAFCQKMPPISLRHFLEAFQECRAFSQECRAFIPQICMHFQEMPQKCRAFSKNASKMPGISQNAGHSGKCLPFSRNASNMPCILYLSI